MAEETLLKFSAELRAKREAKGISLAQISNRTKIDVKFLTAIEEGKFDVLPEIYIRAFIKEYSQALELNPSSIISQYDIAKLGRESSPRVNTSSDIKNVSKSNVESGESSSASQIVSEEKSSDDNILLSKTNSTPDEVDTHTEKFLQNIKFNYILGGIVLLIAGVIFYFAFIQESSNEIINQQNSENFEGLKNQPRYEVSQSPIESDSLINNTEQISTYEQSTNQVKTDSLHLLVQVDSRVWVKIYTDGKVVFQQMVEGGTKIKYRAKNKFAVSVGDVGAVKIYYNDKLIPNIGKAGESRNISITPEGIKYYTINDGKRPSSKN